MFWKATIRASRLNARSFIGLGTTELRIRHRPQASSCAYCNCFSSSDVANRVSAIARDLVAHSAAQPRTYIPLNFLVQQTQWLVSSAALQVEKERCAPVPPPEQSQEGNQAGNSQDCEPPHFSSSPRGRQKLNLYLLNLSKNDAWQVPHTLYCPESSDQDLVFTLFAERFSRGARRVAARGATAPRDDARRLLGSVV